MKKGILTALAIFYPIIAHISVYFHIISFALIYFATLLILLTFDLCFKRSLVLTLLLSVSIIALLLVSLHFSTIFILYLPPIVISLGLFYGFSSSLLPGCTPLITRIALRVYQADFTTEMKNYTRSCTLLWSIIMGVLVLETTLLALFASTQTWSLFCNILNYIFIGLVFVIEYLYRIQRFGQKVPLKVYIKTLIHIDWRYLIKGGHERE